MDMIKARNLTIHAYDQELEEKIITEVDPKNWTHFLKP